MGNLVCAWLLLVALSSPLVAGSADLSCKSAACDGPGVAPLVRRADHRKAVGQVLAVKRSSAKDDPLMRWRIVAENAIPFRLRLLRAAKRQHKNAQKQRC